MFSRQMLLLSLTHLLLVRGRSCCVSTYRQSSLRTQAVSLQKVTYPDDIN
jgi:hypothetical protein